MNKKLFLGIVLFFLAGFIFGENRTGKVVHIETISSMGSAMEIVYLDSNDDKIIDAVFIFNFLDSDKIDFLLPAYIKVGSSVVFNFVREGFEHGIFYFDSNHLISIDGIAKNRIFIP
jgi:hypothetical protein